MKATILSGYKLLKGCCILSLMDETKRKNTEKFSHLRQFNLPIDQYAITSSGVLGIRNLRVMGDIDLIVTPKLWNVLAAQYGITVDKGVKKIVFPGGIIEAFYQDSFDVQITTPQL